jgi:PKD repeat protein
MPGTRSIVLFSLVGVACEQERLRVSPNVPPAASIEAPDRVGRGDLVRIDGSKSRDPDGRIVGFRWDFGDGSPVSTSSSAVTFHAYNEIGTVVVELIVTDSRDATATAMKTIEVLALPQNQSPIARIQAPAMGSANQPIAFDGAMSSDPDGRIVSYEWTFEPSLTESGVSASHTFAADGRYDVTLAVTDDRGARATATHTIEIGSTTNRPPVANAGGDRMVGVGETVMFDGTMSFDPDGRIVEWRWDFGDGSTAMGSTATHVYNVASSFSVTLTVVDDGGLEGSDTVTITAGQPTVDGTYTMEASPSQGSCSGLPATFVATTITFTANGASLQATTPDPESPGQTIPLTGTLTGNSFNLGGTWTDSQGGDHVFSMTGTFAGQDYTATLTETVSIFGTPLCTLNWNLSGTRLP